jgi:hypothetical protein
MERRTYLIGAMIAIMMILVSSYTGAIGIAPGKMNIDYSPGQSRKETLMIINNELKESHVMLYVDEKYENIIQFDEKVIDMTSDDSKKDVGITINIPQDGLSYGPNTIEIIATEFPFRKEELGSNVGSLQAVVSQVIINVPYPGKYLEADFSFVVKDIDDPIAFVIKAENKGQEDIDEVSAVIDIYGPTNELISTLTTTKKAVDKGKMREIVAYYHHNLGIGKYYAKATINYDGSVLEKEVVFEVGDQSIKIVDVTSDEFKLGDIARFQIWIKNNWNEIVDDIYGDMVIKDDYGRTLTKFTTASIQIEPFATKHLHAYWDTAGQEEGTYPAKLVVHYEGQNIEENFNIKLEEDKIVTDFTEPIVAKAVSEEAEESFLDKDTLIIILVVFSMFANTLLIMFLVKKKRKDD